ncbi:LD-carboxypeptidase [soil metagenome]
MIYPKHLPRKAVIGVISPASPQRDPRRLDRGIAYLERLGHHVVLGANARKAYGGYLAGTDEERVADIHDMFANKQVDAIFCARGGYGTSRLLPLLNYGLIKRNPKIFVGFSDTTALQLAIYKRTGLVTFLGAMPSVDMADTFEPESEEQFWRILTSTRSVGIIKQSIPMEGVKGGTAEGILLGGNLSVFSRLIGTPYMPQLKGSILALEDVGEETYRIDRMLMHCELAGIMSKVAGIAYGQFTQSSQRPSNTPHRPVEDVIAERSHLVNGPVLSGLMFGHEAKKLTLPIGAPARMSVGRVCRLSLGKIVS